MQRKKTQRARSSKSRAAIAAAERAVEGPEIFPLPTLHTRLLDSLTSEERKRYPMTGGLGDYFPDALAAVAHISWQGNEKHNPGEELHWARGKSMDHADCVARHLQQRGTIEQITLNGVSHTVRHSAQLAWRALALLQEELEHEYGFELPRGAKAPN